MFANYWKSLSAEEKENLAKKAGTKVSYLRHVASGVHKAGPTLCVKLELVTNGKISRHELRPDYYSSPNAA